MFNDNSSRGDVQRFRNMVLMANMFASPQEQSNVHWVSCGPEPTQEVEVPFRPQVHEFCSRIGESEKLKAHLVGARGIRGIHFSFIS